MIGIMILILISIPFVLFLIFHKKLLSHYRQFSIYNQQSDISTNFYPIQKIDPNKVISTKLSKYLNKNKDSSSQEKVKSKIPKAIAVGCQQGIFLHLLDEQSIKDISNHRGFYKKYYDNYPLLKQILDKTSQFDAQEPKNEIHKLFDKDFLKQIVPQLANIVQKELDYYGQNQDLGEVVIVNIFRRVIGDMLGFMFFGDSYYGFEFEENHITNWLNIIFSEAYIPNVLEQNIKDEKILLEQAYQFLNAQAIAAIEQHNNEPQDSIIENSQEDQQFLQRDNKQYKPLVLRLSELHRHDDSDSSIQDQATNIVNKFIELYSLGVEPTSQLIAITLQQLLKNDLQNNLHIKDELNVYFKNYQKISLSYLDQVKYTSALLNETLRLYSPIKGDIILEVLNDHILKPNNDSQKGIKIAKGTILSAFIKDSNKDREYHDDPEVYKYTRWVTKSKTKQSLTNNVDLFKPFEIAGKVCPSQSISLIMAKLLFGLFMKKFKLELGDNSRDDLELNEELFWRVPTKELTFKISRRSDEQQY